MDKIIIGRSFIREYIVGILMSEFEVSPDDAKIYRNNHQDELLHIKYILYSSDSKDVRKCHALLYILTHGEGEDKGVNMIDKYYSYAGLQQLKDNSEKIKDYAEEYKLPLLTALLYDDDFFDKVEEWYRDIYTSENKKQIERFTESAREIIIIYAFLFPSGKDKNNNWESYSRMKIDYNKVAAGKTVNNTVSGDDECRRIIDFYNQSIQNGNENSSTHNSLGIAYALKGDFDSAIVCFNRAIELNHDNWDAYYNRGLVFCKNDRLSEAVSDFKVIHDKAALDKNIGIIYDASYQLGMLHIALGDIQSGVSYLQALNDNPDYEEASLILKELTKEGLL